MQYCASFVPLVRKAEVVQLDESGSEAKTIPIENALELLLTLLKPDDTLWLMMGSTNAAVALGAFRRGVIVRQLSMARLMSFTGPGKPSEDNRQNGKFQIKTEDIIRAAQEKPDLFYSMEAKQADALEISAVWQLVEDAMEQRKASANFVRARIYHSAIAYGKVGDQILPSDPKEATELLEATLADQLDTKDENSRKRVPSNRRIAFLVEEEDRERSRLERTCRGSAFYHHLFGDVEGVGPAIGARFVAAIERIERFTRPEDLSNYAGMLPRGNERKLPSKFRSKGKTLSRNPALNTACFLLQDYMFQWGSKTELGQILHGQIQRECPCTKEDRKEDKDLRKRYSDAIKRARISMTRHFLEKIVHPKWLAYTS